MSQEFIKERIGNAGLNEACKQQRQLSYFTQSQIQQDITTEYLEAWANRKYATEDVFLNWVKSVFRTDNFLSFYKYLRYPLPSSKLINDRIKPQLQRVFFADDSYFNYTIKGESVECPKELEIEKFNEDLFNALLYHHNNIIIHDLKDVNTPFREIIDIDKVVAIESKDSVIYRLAYTATVAIETEMGVKNEKGYLYMDNKMYAFYSTDYELLASFPHDLGECPADYIAKEPFADCDVVRKSIFSYIREELEEFVFLKTLQRMTEPNGSIPITTKLKFRDKAEKRADIKGSTDKQPMQSNLIGSQKAHTGSEVAGSRSPLQTGSIINVPMIKKEDGGLDMDAVKNFINFFYTPVEAMEYINKRIKEIEQSIMIAILGEMNQNKERKNELDVRSGFVSAEDKLRNVSLNLSRARKRSDYKFLALQYGPMAVSNEAFYGSDFFLEDQNKLYELFEKSPNPIERKNIMIRMTRNRHKFNREKGSREVVLYNLLPYISDADFQTAIDSQMVDQITFLFQSQFNYWIGMFEAEYGDILLFWEGIEGTNSEKMILINRLIFDIIEKSNKNNTAIVPNNPQT